MATEDFPVPALSLVRVVLVETKAALRNSFSHIGIGIGKAWHWQTNAEDAYLEQRTKRSLPLNVDVPSRLNSEGRPHFKQP